jgi:hypothetical protein
MEKMLITFLSIKGTGHFELISQGQTANEAYYVEALQQLHEAVRSKVLKFVTTIGFSTTTMLQLTRRSLLSNV